MNNRKKTPDLLGDILAAPGKGMKVNNPQPQSQGTTTVAEAATRLDVSEKTIRKWAGDFADGLGKGANPGKGQPRSFSDEDMEILANIAQRRSANVSYADIHEAFRNDREVSLKQPAGKVPYDQIEQSALSASQEYEERIERLVKERDQLRKQLQATKAELARAQEDQADRQKAEAATEVIPIEELPPLDSKQRVAMDNKADHQGESQSDPGQIPTLEDQLRHLGEKLWWQVWRR